MTKKNKKIKTKPAISKKFIKKKEKKENKKEDKCLLLKENLKKTENDKVLISFDQKHNLKRLIRDIYNVREARRQINFLGVDVKNVSRHIGEKFIDECQKKLNKIYKIMTNKELSDNKKSKKYFDLSKSYNRMLPHNFYLPSLDLFLINNESKIKKEIRILELLKSFRELRNKDNEIKEAINQVDNNSVNLNESANMSVNNLEKSVEEENHQIISYSYYEKALYGTKYLFYLVDEQSKEFERIKSFMLRFSDKYMCTYPKLKLLQLYRLTKKEEHFKEYECLYWYGCETPHFYSILRHGLRFPITLESNNIYKYGKGILISHNPYTQLKYCTTRYDIAYLFVCGNSGLKSKVIHHYHPEYPKNLNEKYDSICIEHKIRLKEIENEDYSNKWDSYCDYVVYDLSKINLLYIAKILIP